MAKKLYMVFGMDSGHDASVVLPDPKATLTETAVRPVMQTIIDKSALLVGTASPVSIVDAYIRETTEVKII